MMDAELDRERNDFWFGAPPPTRDEPDPDEVGRFAVVIFDEVAGEERDRTTWSTRGRANKIAERSRETLAIAGSEGVTVTVKDLTEEENSDAAEAAG